MTVTSSAETLSADEARRLVLTAQGVIGRPFPRTGPAAVEAVLQRLGAVQLDTISVLARSHELVPYARLGAVGRGAVEQAYWGESDADGYARAFEYWSHAACVLPVRLWPWFAFRRRHYERKGERWHQVPRQSLDHILGRLRDEGPLTTRDVGGAKAGGEWWDWSESKVALEWLLDIGEVVCVRREGWRRVYDLPDRVIDPALRTPGVSSTWTDADGIEGPTDDESMRYLLTLSAQVMGVGTMGDLLDVHRLGPRYTGRAHLDSVFADLVDAGTLTPVAVRGWRGPVFADSALLAAGPATGRHRTTLLSPFDSLIWHRGRTERVFGFTHLFEPYVPAAKRQHGYFTMPVLHGGRLVARVDPKRAGRTLEARTIILENSPRAVEGTAIALAEAAAWVGCTDVRVGEVRPAADTAAVKAAVAEAVAK